MKTLSCLPLHWLTQCAEWVGFRGRSRVALRSLSRKVLKHVVPVLMLGRRKKRGTERKCLYAF